MSIDATGPACVECVWMHVEPSAHHGNAACNNRIMTVEIRAPAGSLVFMALPRRPARTDRTRPARAPLGASSSAPPNSLLAAARGSESVLPGVTWPSGSEVHVGGEPVTVGPSDRTIWTSALT